MRKAHKQAFVTGSFWVMIIFLGTFLAGMAGYTVTYLWEKHNAYAEQKEWLDWQADRIKNYQKEHPNDPPPILGYPQGQEQSQIIPNGSGNGQPDTF